MLTDDPCAQAYDAFTASLDQPTADLVTKLMLHTRTRPDDPNMVGVCLTTIATIKNADAQARILDAQQTTLRALEDMKTDPAVLQGIQNVALLTRSLDAVRTTVRYGTRFFGILAVVVGLLGACGLVVAWKAGYDQARADIGALTHRQLCNDLNGYVARVSTHWRALHMAAAADRLAAISQRDCSR